MNTTKGDLELKAGQAIKIGRKKYLVCKVNKKTVKLRHYRERAIRGTNNRILILGDFYTAEYCKIKS